MTAADRYAELPPAVRRANLVAHRQSLLSDRMAQELHVERLDAFGSDDAAAARDRLAKFDVLLDRVAGELAALPPDAPPAS